MSFSKNGTYVYPFSIPMAPGNTEIIPWDAMQAVTGAPTARLFDYKTDAEPVVQPSVTADTATVYLIGVTIPPDAGDAIFVVEVKWTCASGRVKTDRLALLVSSK